MTSIDTVQNSMLTPAAEKRIAKDLSPPVAWPTLTLAVVLPAAYWTIVGLGLTGVLPLWACSIVLTPTSYAHYTLVHESIHGNLVPGYPRLRWLNTFVGWIGALGLGFNWPMMMRNHALHHAHTNTDEDPDIVVRGSFGQLLMKWVQRHLIGAMIPLAVLKYLSPAKYGQATAALRGSEVWQASAVAGVVVKLLAVAVVTGRVLDWFCLLYIPTRLAGLMLTIFFQWLPHYPFDRTERYLNTRISLWTGGRIVTLQQNFHLMHHLWPSVPFYNYRPALRAPTSDIDGQRLAD